MLTVGKLKELLEKVPNSTEVLMHSEVRDCAYEITFGKYITDFEEAPYDGNGLIEVCIGQTGGVFVLSDC